MNTTPEFSGRDIFVDGPLSARETGLCVAEALGLPLASVSSKFSKPEEEEASWKSGGRITVYELEPDSDLRLKVDIDLFSATINTDSLIALARAQGLTIAWHEDESNAHDYFVVVRTDGAKEVRWLSFEETDDSYAVRIGSVRAT